MLSCCYCCCLVDALKIFHFKNIFIRVSLEFIFLNSGPHIFTARPHSKIKLTPISASLSCGPKKSGPTTQNLTFQFFLSISKLFLLFSPNQLFNFVSNYKRTMPRSFISSIFSCLLYKSNQLQPHFSLSFSSHDLFFQG